VLTNSGGTKGLRLTSLLGRGYVALPRAVRVTTPLQSVAPGRYSVLGTRANKTGNLPHTSVLGIWLLTVVLGGSACATSVPLADQAAPGSTTPVRESLTPTEDPDAAVVAAASRIRALVGQSHPGFASQELDGANNRLTIWWKRGVAQPFAPILEDLRRTVDVVVLESPYSRIELEQEIDRLLIIAKARSLPLNVAYPKKDGTGLVIQVETASASKYPTLASLGLESVYPVTIVAGRDPVPLSYS